MKAEKRSKRSKKVAIIVTTIFCIVIVFIIVLKNIMISNVYAERELEQIKSAKVGDYVSFGTYEQDNNTSNGEEDIEWLVLEVADRKALVISKYALDCKQYNTSYTCVTWENCSLRKWLNDDFVNIAFSYAEKAMISTVTVPADKNPKYSISSGNTTQDKVFLLSITEVNKYFNSDSERKCKATAYAVADGAWVSNDNSSCLWWLRSPGRYEFDASYVYNDGSVLEHGSYVDLTHNAVRPALWIDLNS